MAVFVGAQETKTQGLLSTKVLLDFFLSTVQILEILLEMVKAD